MNRAVCACCAQPAMLASRLRGLPSSCMPVQSNELRGLSLKIGKFDIRLAAQMQTREVGMHSTKGHRGSILVHDAVGLLLEKRVDHAAVVIWCGGEVHSCRLYICIICLRSCCQQAHCQKSSARAWRPSDASTPSLTGSGM